MLDENFHGVWVTMSFIVLWEIWRERQLFVVISSINIWLCGELCPHPAPPLDLAGGTLQDMMDGRCWWCCWWVCFSESLRERAKSFSTSVTDLSLAATTTVINLRRAAEHLTRLIISDSDQRTTSASPSSSSSSSSSADNELLQQTVAMLTKLSSALDSVRTEVSKRQTRVKIPSTMHITSDGSDYQCHHRSWYSTLFNFLLTSCAYIF